MCVSRPRDPSYSIRTEISSNLPHRMLQMVGYEPENDLVSFHLSFVDISLHFSKLFVAKLHAAGANIFSKARASGFYKHAVAKLHAAGANTFSKTHIFENVVPKREQHTKTFDAWDGRKEQ